MTTSLQSPRVASPPPAAHWLETTATVTACRWQSDTAFLSWQDEASPALGTGHFVTAFKYAVAGAEYAGEFESRIPFDRGQKFPLLYDPQAPQHNACADGNLPSWPVKLATWGLGFAGMALLVRWALM